MPRLCRSSNQRLPRDGDILAINRGGPEVQISDVEFEKRRAVWQPRISASRYHGITIPSPSGSARQGAATQSRRGREDVLCGYVDIFCLLPCLGLGWG
jgi:hypothetical protein